MMQVVEPALLDRLNKDIPRGMKLRQSILTNLIEFEYFDNDLFNKILKMNVYSADSKNNCLIKCWEVINRLKEENIPFPELESTFKYLEKRINTKKDILWTYDLVKRRPYTYNEMYERRNIELSDHSINPFFILSDFEKDAINNFDKKDDSNLSNRNLVDSTINDGDILDMMNTGGITTSNQDGDQEELSPEEQRAQRDGGFTGLEMGMSGVDVSAETSQENDEEKVKEE